MKFKKKKVFHSPMKSEVIQKVLNGCLSKKLQVKLGGH
ncbi:hypothetical protein LEP1GSC103_0002 [Leptospira borgpetersenii serovar Javanica str. UI 09931]|uniref:Uncharacterized protein n=1 Tax=Leptospira borgpetersenii serovar Javanica str. UI 09931 TaxID=1049767 RepID=A0AAV3J6I5_LEPBO|nr:hypothetical protein LEP1GSC103_0002 [Leptospira borgpetersenii serovar Javanica str. UI 09931]